MTALNENPDLSIRESFYRTFIHTASRSKRKDLVIEYLQKMKEEFPRNRSVKDLENSFSPKRAIKEEKKVPHFEFASISDTTKIITEKDMLGKKYLIHIWGDWCGPCRLQIEAIRNINNKFSGNNFAVLSVSICFSKKNLLEFQKDHPMPWFNTHVDMRNDTNKFLENFEVSSIPREILVDETGTIIAVNDLDKIFSILSAKGR